MTQSALHCGLILVPVVGWQRLAAPISRSASHSTDGWLRLCRSNIVPARVAISISAGLSSKIV